MFSLADIRASPTQMAEELAADRLSLSLPLSLSLSVLPCAFLINKSLDIFCSLRFASKPWNADPEPFFLWWCPSSALSPLLKRAMFKIWCCNSLSVGLETATSAHPSGWTIQRLNLKPLVGMMSGRVSVTASNVPGRLSNAALWPKKWKNDSSMWKQFD